LRLQAKGVSQNHPHTDAALGFKAGARSGAGDLSSCLQLEHRVADQVGEIERMSRLRRFLPPQVADLIVASGSEKQLESHRRRSPRSSVTYAGSLAFQKARTPKM
jgi:hypothetical protein